MLWCVLVCVCVCMHAGVCVCVSVCMHACVCACLCVFKHDTYLKTFTEAHKFCLCVVSYILDHNYRNHRCIKTF